MAALDSLLGVGAELIVRATRGICDGSRLNADQGRTLTAARISDWSEVLSLYAEKNAEDVRVSA
ncbi:hypothetical protein BWI15_04820 [Kribbella sp. ALI-6-A]|uniref:hypothetical protein n=1 Tax=Kribbella sp. ALI-6-A TaxID=1933817 RepID=UPI00097BDB18|nr:hypothetical protein [Kribbella sp. ALI-6-A]ONI76623.1 hypothetical protein BWI15_04820 [Kribbella sp. ALI-6-A]